MAAEAIDQASPNSRNRFRLSLVAATGELYHLLKNGVRTTVTDSKDDGETVEIVARD